MTSTLVVARDPDSGLCAFYVDGALVWNFGSNDPFHQHISGSTTLDDALEEIAPLLGFEYEYQSRHPLAHKSWTDYGWEWDAEWPERLEDAPVAEAMIDDSGGPQPTGEYEGDPFVDFTYD